MKPLEELNNVERARLLYELFPEEIPAAVEFIHNMTITVEEEQERMRSAWNNLLFTFDAWLNITGAVRTEIEGPGKPIAQSCRLFSEKLFGGYSALFSGYCLALYVTDRKHPNEKFATMVTLLFGFQPTI